MLIYRLQHAHGGHGPWCDDDGERIPDAERIDHLPDLSEYPPTKEQTDGLHGCVSLEELLHWFPRGNQDGPTGPYRIYVYDIPDEDVHYHRRQVQFPKHYAGIGVPYDETV